jgi:hypothetical protein
MAKLTLMVLREIEHEIRNVLMELEWMILHTAERKPRNVALSQESLCQRLLKVLSWLGKVEFDPQSS